MPVLLKDEARVNSPNRCATPFEWTVKRSPQFKCHRSRGTSKIWDSTDVQKFFAERKDGSHRCNLCGRRFGSKTGGRHYVAICVLCVEPASWYSELYYWRLLARETNKSGWCNIITHCTIAYTLVKSSEYFY